MDRAEIAVDAESVFRSVFASSDPWDSPFTDNMTRRAVLYPVGPTLFEDEFQSIAAAAAQVGEHRMYVASLSPAGNVHYTVPFDYPAYAAIPKGEEMALYGRAGWGLIMSMDCHGVLGGRPTFVEKVRQTFPPVEPPHPPGEIWQPVPFDEQIRVLLREFRGWHLRGYDPDLPSLRTLLTHVYGDQRATELLAEHGL
jgi:hypothetical protein